MGLTKWRATKIRPKVVKGDIFYRFFNFDKCRLEVAGDIVSSAAVDEVGLDFGVKFGDSMSNRSRDILAAHFVTDDERTTSEAGHAIRQEHHSAFCLINNLSYTLLYQ